jgi:hypothetical protein
MGHRKVIAYMTIQNINLYCQFLFDSTIRFENIALQGPTD